jgi:hypothetical protein
MRVSGQKPVQILQKDQFYRALHLAHGISIAGPQELAGDAILGRQCSDSNEVIK